MLVIIVRISRKSFLKRACSKVIDVRFPSNFNDYLERGVINEATIRTVLF